MSTRNKWTEEEDKILVQAIKANPHNKAQAFRTAASQVNHSVKCCSNRWYQHLSNPESKYYIGTTVFTMIGMKSRLDNRTINRDGVHITPTRAEKGLWSKIKSLLGL